MSQLDDRDQSRPPAAPSTTGEEDFASLLDRTAVPPRTAQPRPGDRITGTLVQLGDDQCFVDYGGRSELPIATSELKDASGELTAAVGDSITGWVAGRGEDLRLVLKSGGRGRDTAWIAEALASGVPVTGKVRETNKGGFVVDLGGQRAFCPISQIDDGYVNDPAVWVGRELEFRVLEFVEGGRRLVISRRVLLEEARARRAVETRRHLQSGDVVEGEVKRLMPYGAFLDIGGLQGLLHVSQISHAHVDDPAEHLREGQRLQVQIIEIQDLGGPRERISLSLKSLADDPWSDAAQKLPVGEWVQGVVSGLADFGVFVELLPGVRGMIHVSELSDQRVTHPRDVLREGQQVRVKIKEFDRDRRRISLSLIG